jgi:hypothetical protein
MPQFPVSKKIRWLPLRKFQKLGQSFAHNGGRMDINSELVSNPVALPVFGLIASFTETAKFLVPEEVRRPISALQ